MADRLSSAMPPKQDERPLGVRHSRSDYLAGKFDVGEEIGRIVGIEVWMDRREDRIRIALGKLDVSNRDADRIQPITIGAGLCRRAQIAPTNFKLRHFTWPSE